MSCCLGIVHVILAIGINAHMILTARDMNSESQICYFVIPCSYALFMIFSLFVTITSCCSMKMTKTPEYTLIYLSKLKDSYIFMVFFGCIIIAAVFLPAKICYSHNKMSIWPAFWGAFSIIESVIMVIYLDWLLKEIKEAHNAQREKISESVLTELQ